MTHKIDSLIETLMVAVQTEDEAALNSSIKAIQLRDNVLVEALKSVAASCMCCYDQTVLAEIANDALIEVGEIE